MLKLDLFGINGLSNYSWSRIPDQKKEKKATGQVTSPMSATRGRKSIWRVLPDRQALADSLHLLLSAVCHSEILDIVPPPPPFFPLFNRFSVGPGGGGAFSAPRHTNKQNTTANCFKHKKSWQRFWLKVCLLCSFLNRLSTDGNESRKWVVLLEFYLAGGRQTRLCHNRDVKNC